MEETSISKYNIAHYPSYLRPLKQTFPPIQTNFEYQSEKFGSLTCFKIKLRETDKTKREEIIHGRVRNLEETIDFREIIDHIA